MTDLNLYEVVFDYGITIRVVAKNAEAAMITAKDYVQICYHNGDKRLIEQVWKKFEKVIVDTKVTD